jgi:hypothetical protein
VLVVMPAEGVMLEACLRHDPRAGTQGHTSHLIPEFWVPDVSLTRNSGMTGPLEKFHT